MVHNTCCTEEAGLEVAALVKHCIHRRMRQEKETKYFKENEVSGGNKKRNKAL